MSPDDQGVFWQLGQDARTGEPLLPPFCEAREVARLIHDDLTEVGLSTNAIRKVACALLNVITKRRGDDFSTYERGAR